MTLEDWSNLGGLLSIPLTIAALIVGVWKGIAWYRAWRTHTQSYLWGSRIQWVDLFTTHPGRLSKKARRLRRRLVLRTWVARVDPIPLSWLRREGWWRARSVLRDAAQMERCVITGDHAPHLVILYRTLPSGRQVRPIGSRSRHCPGRPASYVMN